MPVLNTFPSAPISAQSFICPFTYTASHPHLPLCLPACHRVFPDGMSVLRQLFRGVRLQEACFRDVVILYRAAVPDAGVSMW